MIKHYLKVAFRNLMKYKTQSLVSIIDWQSASPVLRYRYYGFVMR